jgi:hypothetical protein
MSFSNRWFVGAVVILIGLIWLLVNAGVIPADFWQYFLPVLVILIGVKMILVEKKGE